MNGTQLKNSILQWAIQGKLVPQDLNDEPASVLLERIRAEKAKLVKEKKIKKDKNESIIYRGEDNSYYEKFIATGEVKCIDEEIPFEIPATWEWCRLGYIFSHCTGKALNGTHRKGNLYTYITTSNLYWDRFELSSLKEMYFTEEELGKCTATKGDLLVCEGGDIGRSAIWNYGYDIRIQNHIHKLRPYIPLCTRFFYYVMYLYKGIGYIGGKGIGIQGLSSGALHNILIPTPSINEQERIVSQIEAIMPIAAKYEKSQEELNQLNDSIHNRLRKSILQEAIQGKLVPQIPEEGTAQELLEQIRQEKQKLVKEGKLKKSALTDSIIYKGDDNKYFEKIGKQEIDITDEIPFEIPTSWSWTRIHNILQVNPKNMADDQTKSAFIPMEKIQASYGSIYTFDVVKWGEIKKSFTHFADGDIAFAKITPCFQNRKSVIFSGLPNGIGAGTTELKVLRPIGEIINRWYLLYFLKTPYFIDEATFKGTANQQRIITGYLENKLFPLPPLQEQDRIVAAINAVASIMSR